MKIESSVIDLLIIYKKKHTLKFLKLFVEQNNE